MAVSLAPAQIDRLGTLLISVEERWAAMGLRVTAECPLPSGARARWAKEGPRWCLWWLDRVDGSAHRIQHGSVERRIEIANALRVLEGAIRDAAVEREERIGEAVTFVSHYLDLVRENT